MTEHGPLMLERVKAGDRLPCDPSRIVRTESEEEPVLGYGSTRSVLTIWYEGPVVEHD